MFIVGDFYHLYSENCLYHEDNYRDERVAGRLVNLIYHAPYNQSVASIYLAEI